MLNVDVRLYSGLDENKILQTIFMIGKVVVKLIWKIDVNYQIEYIPQYAVCVSVEESELAKIRG